jgi:methyl-accepting chemotaxis protein
VALLLALLPLAPARAQHRAEAEDSSLSLREGWRYRWGDSPADAQAGPKWAGESGEGPEWLPGEALQTPPGRGEHTFLWLSIPVPRVPLRQPALLLGSAPNAVEVYVGGRRVFASGRVDPAGRELQERDSWVLVPLPEEALGGRVLMRFQSRSPSIGVMGKARLGEYDALLNRALSDGLPSYVLGAGLFSLGVLALLAAALRARLPLLRPFGLFAVSAGLALVCMSGVPLALGGDPGRWFPVQMLAIFAFVPTLAAFVDAALLEGRRRWFRRVVVGNRAAALVAGVLVLWKAELIPTVLPLYVLGTNPVLLLCVVVPAQEAWRGSRDARVLLVGLVAVVVTVAATAAATVGGLSLEALGVHWGVASLALSLLVILGRRAVGMVQEFATRTRLLEARQGEVQALAQRMGAGAAELVAVVGQLRASTETQNAGISVQAQALQEAQVTVSQIRQVALATAVQARSLAAAAEGAERAGQQGASAIEQTLATMEGLRDDVAATAKRIAAVDARAREISGIVDTVKALADQSNMLALNAAIEAVRSGEHGKGFSVVAREVRNLADQSIDATERIREVLASVGEGVREAVQMSTRGEERARAGAETVRTSGEQLRQLATVVSETSSRMRDVSAAVSQQEAGTRQMETAINDLSGQMERTLGVLRETEAATETVQGLAEDMAGVARTTLGQVGPPPAAGAPRAAATP